MSRVQHSAYDPTTVFFNIGTVEVETNGSSTSNPSDENVAQFNVEDIDNDNGSNFDSDSSDYENRYFYDIDRDSDNEELTILSNY